jgi:hypothetical protein
MHHFVPGVHYESVRYDLSDLPSRTYQLIQEAKKDPSRLERMGATAMLSAVNYTHVLALTKSVAWVLGRVKDVSPWEVRAPEEESGWILHKFPEGWEVKARHSPSFKSALKARFRDQFN